LEKSVDVKGERQHFANLGRVVRALGDTTSVVAVGENREGAVRPRRSGSTAWWSALGDGRRPAVGAERKFFLTSD